MPLLESSYKPTFLFKNGHFATMYAAKLRRLSNPYEDRKRLELPDGDFIDLDYTLNPENKKYVLLLHGLEGNAQRSYMKGAALSLIAAGWNVIAFNFRGCSGTPNRLYESYNAGRTADLEFLIEYLVQTHAPEKLSLVGFSLGGNLALKYLGTQSPGWKHIHKAVAVSAPLDLKGTLLALNNRENWVYRTVFLFSLKSKLKAKAQNFPDRFDLSQLKKINSLLEFDHLYTAPAHGFKDAFDYYAKNSCGQFLPELKTPVLLLNAHNDSFLSEESYPNELAKELEYLFLEAPVHGGHVGFINPNNVYYSEQRICEFLDE